MLAEASGGQVLEEYALGVLLTEECARRGIRIGESDIQAERRLLGQSLARAAGLPPGESETLITNVRRTRGLGDVRFRDLLQRNAQLRAIVRADPTSSIAVTISEADIDTAYQLKYGPRVRVRLILVRSNENLQQATARLSAGAAFADVASTASIDPSSVRGGLLDPFSDLDSRYPVAVRRVLQPMAPGQVSEPIAVTWGDQTGFAIVKLEERIGPVAGAPSREAAAKDLEAEVRLVRERAQMDKVAVDVLRSAGISPMDRSLGWSWEQWRGPRTGQ